MGSKGGGVVDRCSIDRDVIGEGTIARVIDERVRGIVAEYRSLRLSDVPRHPSLSVPAV